MRFRRAHGRFTDFADKIAPTPHRKTIILRVDPTSHDITCERAGIEDKYWKSREPRGVHIIKTESIPYMKYAHGNTNKNFEVFV